MNDSASKKEPLLITTSTFPRWKGDTEPAFVLNLAKNLSDKFDVHVLAPHYPGAEKEETRGKLKIHRYSYFWPYFLQKLAYGAMMQNIRRSPLLVFLAPFFLFAQIIAILRICKKYNIRRINSHFLIPQGLIGSICSKMGGYKNYVTVHAAGIFALDTLPFKKQIAKFIYTNSEKIIFVSKYNQKLFEKISNIKKSDKYSKVLILSLRLLELDH
jgi:hypothetical protein